MSFAFSFAGDDIEEDHSSGPQLASVPTPTSAPSAFPIQGKPQLPPASHTLASLLATLPSKIAYSTLDVVLDSSDNDTSAGSSTTVRLPRRELWDVRVQLMAEDDGEGTSGAEEGLGESDVKTGVYEGGFKSWESSVDLVKVLLSGRLGSLVSNPEKGLKVVELGCGTALPSLALFQQALGHPPSVRGPLTLVLADYNPSVLHLVTLPNLVLTWALHHKDSQSHVIPALADAFSLDGELELLPAVLDSFVAYLAEHQIELLFLSGGWSQEFASIAQAGLEDSWGSGGNLLVLGAETIYSPFALRAFAETVFQILRSEQQRQQQQGESPSSACLVAAKRLYFGVGGSLDDFVDLARSMGAEVTGLREEAEGVRRGVVQVVLNAV